MSIKDWPGGVVSKDQVVPSGPYLNSTASGMWTMDQVANYTKQGIWPTAGNVEPGVEAFFSTYLYTANNAGLTITNGIDLASEGGLVWGKSRSASQNHRLYDTEGNGLYSNLTSGSFGSSGRFTANSDGFDLTASSGIVGGSGFGGPDYASWTFRKAPKFFDVVTYTGTGVNRSISHSLSSEPGMIIIKRTDASESWIVYHRSAEGTGTYWSKLELESTGIEYGGTRLWGAGTGEDHTDSTFFVSNAGQVNSSGGTFVAYLFAHETDAKSMIQCGSFTTDSGGNFSVDLGYDPQWVMIKSTDFVDSWMLIDVMRSMSQTATKVLRPNTDGAESNYTQGYCTSTATGFTATTPGLFTGSKNFIYMAIRAPMMVAPTAGTEVFAMDMDGGTNNHYTSGFPVDLGVYKSKLNTYNWSFNDRLRGALSLKSNTNAAENGNALAVFDNNTGWADSAALTSEYPSWMWKRARGFFDIVAYTGTGSPLTLNHNLGVAPELVLYKSRSTAEYWFVQSSELTSVTDSYVFVNDDNAESSAIGTIWRTPDATTFGIDYTGNLTGCNTSGTTYIAYLFATLAGVSKVGSVTHSGTTNVDCGFSAGARFVLLKRTDATGDWYIWDSARGISAGNDPYLQLNSTAAEVTNTDYIDPLSSGFTITSTFTAGDYIFYAIA
jgi:hypothetical protein|tara:strand:- start:22 stop:2016 length:1995 start_codon:yes stop_codon:yes gene_type:complete